MSSWFSVLTGAYLATEEVTLGRLVLNLREPGQDFCPSAPVKLAEGDISKAPFYGIELFLQTERSRGIRSKLTKLFTFDAATASESAHQITTTQATTYKILNSGHFFQRVMSDEATKQWLEKHVYKKRTAYMAVGLITVSDPSVKTDKEKSGEIKASAVAPFGEIVLPGSSALPQGDSMDIKLQLHARNARTENAKFMAPGDRIVGVQYRKLRLRGLKKDQVGTADLDEHARWETYFGDKTPRGPKGVPADVIEVSFDKGGPEADLEERNENYKEFFFEGKNEEDLILLVSVYFQLD